jgi:predicted methyltransferase
MRAGLIAGVVLAAALAASTLARAQSEQLRDSWQHVAELFAAASVRAGARIADIGAGDGYLTVRLAQAVGPTGKVYAVDVDTTVVETLRARLADAHLTNVEVIVGADDDPRLPASGVDGAIILNAYHEMPKGESVLRHVFAALKPGGGLVVCEPTPRTAGQSRAAQAGAHVIDPVLVIDDLRAAGFAILERKDTFATNLGGSNFGFIASRRP